MNREHIPDGGQLIEPDVDALCPSPTNPRTVFDAEYIAGLAESIKIDGVLQPIIVRLMPDHVARQTNSLAPLEIVCGECRFRAARLAGLVSIPAILRTLTDIQVVRIQLVENLQRKGLNPIEEAEGIARLMASGLCADEIAEQVGKGKSKSHIYAKHKLLALCPAVREALILGNITESVALLIARIPVAELQLDALDVVTARDDYTGEQMSFRAAKAHITTSYTKPLAKAPFDPADADLAPEAGDCTKCPQRLGNMDGCEPGNANVCTNPKCYEAKRQAHNVRMLNLPAETPRIDVPRANTSYPTNYTDFDNAGLRVLGNTYDRDPQHRTYAQWLADNGETVPVYIHTCPHVGDSRAVARIADLAAAADRIARKAAATEEQARLDVAVEQPAEAEEAELPEATTEPHRPAPAAPAPKAAAPAPKAAAPTPKKPAGHPREHSPLAVAYAQYRSELKATIRANPPLMFGGPLLVMIAQAVRGQSGAFSPPTESEAADILIGTAIEYAEKWGLSENLLEQLAEALGIDHAELLERHVPVPEGCARPNEHGVFQKQKTLGTRAGKAGVLIHRTKTAEGWRAEPEFSSPTRSWSGPISINTPPFATEAEAIADATSRARPTIADDGELSPKARASLLFWLDRLHAESTGIEPAEATEIAHRRAAEEAAA
ncbi:hypothetical protein GCM10007933_02660 [Zoogloea oryzae]|uniref:ParB-like N-terminal domain-containing protein n=1 Tax=Zoogloea oryzae TaxID=310767 RepID=A0ABQ6F6E7_9RHOO|nr:ParB/RepB/Spo0J family partition protein [Zoogloea oryzae]GLT20814.1 hypothetical protein GCM10007933_02660 [Zoogloea oryzae]